MNSIKTQLPTIIVSKRFEWSPCNRICVTEHTHMGPWYKQMGYNKPCLCLSNKINLKYVDTCKTCADGIVNVDDIRWIGIEMACVECYKNMYPSK